MTTSVRIPDAFSGEINDLSASSAHVPGALLPSVSVSLISIPNNSNITASSIYENGVVPPASGTQPNTNSTTPSNESSLSATGAALVTCYNAASTVRDRQCGMITSSAIPNTISNVGDERVLDVNDIVPNLSDLPSEPMVALGNHEAAAPKENNVPMTGAGKKSSKMRPGTTNTARCGCG